MKRKADDARLRQDSAEGDQRFKRGTARLTDVDGRVVHDAISQLGDLGRYIVEFAFGDIYNRDGLNLREREIATVAMLTVMGGREPQLRVHIGAAFHVGLTAQEVEEIIIQTVPYAGFPTAINALNLLKEIVASASYEVTAGP